MFTSLQSQHKFGVSAQMEEDGQSANQWTWKRPFVEKEAAKVLFVGVAVLEVSPALPHAYMEGLMEEQQSRDAECGFWAGRTRQQVKAH